MSNASAARRSIAGSLESSSVIHVRGYTHLPPLPPGTNWSRLCLVPPMPALAGTIAIGATSVAPSTIAVTTIPENRDLSTKKRALGAAALPEILGGTGAAPLSWREGGFSLQAAFIARPVRTTDGTRLDESCRSQAFGRRKRTETSTRTPAKFGARGDDCVRETKVRRKLQNASHNCPRCVMKIS